MGRMGGIEPVAQVFLGAGVTTAFHPFNYTKTLVQVNHFKRRYFEVPKAWQCQCSGTIPESEIGKSC